MTPANEPSTPSLTKAGPLINTPDYYHRKIEGNRS